jgi:hypothetical protein
MLFINDGSHENDRGKGVEYESMVIED